jgi:hypothetical protein
MESSPEFVPFFTSLQKVSIFFDSSFYVAALF